MTTCKHFSFGVDWSMTSPSLVAQREGEVHVLAFVDPHVSGRGKNKIVSSRSRDFSHTKNGVLWCFSLRDKPKWECQQERYHVHASVAVDFIQNLWVEDTEINMEDYAFSATSNRVYQIAESAQTFKSELWRRTGRSANLVKPNQIKSFATGKGNADKNSMASAFFAKNGFWVHEAIGFDVADSNPASDVVDAYYASLMRH